MPVFDLIGIGSRNTVAIAKVSLALIISHFRSSKVIERNAIRGDLFQPTSFPVWNQY
ncbi:hypothetical protein [Mesorhizobium sp.]|uniref:hypothetical protein n=1 Tax=Mesorhizobium sp. TaxID=1871066 RepID=UPI0025FB0735|nr:hypothetical protein [Mesorhizobium sp.]